MQPLASHNAPEYKVSEITGAIKTMVEDRFGVVRVRGEISGFKLHSSGHAYFSLKDEHAVLSAVCWRGTIGKLPFKPEDGLEVIASGKITTYPGQSKYQIVVDRLEAAGAGALMAMLEERKQRLAKEGLFDARRKRPLPFLPQCVGVITSPTGAVIRDILHRISERCGVHVIVWPVAVQGSGAAEQIARAIELCNKFGAENSILNPESRNPKPDLIIVARGGGSVEDLWAFNEEIVVRAAANSTIPIISAVGHETDTTLIDFAADKRAPTPTAAAEMAVPVKTELVSTLKKLELRAHDAVARGFAQRLEQLAQRAKLLPRLPEKLAITTQRLDEWAERLQAAPSLLLQRKSDRLNALHPRVQPHAINQRLAQGTTRTIELFARLSATPERFFSGRSDRLHATTRMLEAMNITHTLKRGFVLATDATGTPVTSVKCAKGTLTLLWSDGQAQATIEPATVS